MVDALLDFMLGPMRGIGDFYFEHQMIFNPIVIAIAAGKMFFSRKKKHEAEA
ncbi:hypothetical protein MUN89_06175 [Halobacillus salinarum]|uniref:Uncharacterized protein n=1 Tax=Halobacillus salinarum TaxID=2932257 RepID=A0ABY4ENV9_9BACI|nr:hypothetical protein [Halobacillus salinarum]UOQ45528.1 hypothetical protein MUN89_06175 [Halobacillus salinarum]